MGTAPPRSPVAMERGADRHGNFADETGLLGNNDFAAGAEIMVTNQQEGGDTSDAEEDYSEADSNSAPDLLRPPNLADLLLLDEGRCRAPMRSKIPSGAKVACICGKLALECKRHAEYRVINDADRAEPGYYLRAVGVKGEHGLQGIRYPVAHVEELRTLQDQEMNRAAQTLTMDDEDPEEPCEEAGLSPRRVSFGAATRVTLGPTQQGGRPSVVDLSQSPTRTPPHLWFGLEDTVGERWIVSDLSTARDYENTGAFRLVKVFTDNLEAERWRGAQGKSASRSKSTAPPGRNQVEGGTQDTSCGDSSSSSDSARGNQPRTRKPRSAPKETRARRRRTTRKGTRYDSDSESSPYGESSDSSTSSSSSSSRRGQGRKKHSRSRHKRSLDSGRKGSGSRRKNKAGPNQPLPRPGEDKSTGDKDLIYGMSIHGTEIEAALGPEDMRLRDADELFNAAMDVTSLPGMFGSVGGVQFSDDMQGRRRWRPLSYPQRLEREHRSMIHYGKHRSVMPLGR